MIWSIKKSDLNRHKIGSGFKLPQEKCIEFCLTSLLPYKHFRGFIDIITSQMKSGSILSKFDNSICF